MTTNEFIEEADLSPARASSSSSSSPKSSSTTARELGGAGIEAGASSKPSAPGVGDT